MIAPTTAIETSATAQNVEGPVPSSALINSCSELVKVVRVVYMTEQQKPSDEWLPSDHQARHGYRTGHRTF